jgi:hypothetical protein
MTSVQLLPAGLSALVLAAHFLRAGNSALLLASLSLIALMFVRRAWAARAIQVGLLLGTLEWLRTLLFLVAVRKQAGEPFVRLAVILGAVAAVTGASALVLQTRTLRQHFGRAPHAGP